MGRATLSLRCCNASSEASMTAGAAAAAAAAAGIAQMLSPTPESVETRASVPTRSGRVVDASDELNKLRGGVKERSQVK